MTDIAVWVSGIAVLLLLPNAVYSVWRAIRGSRK